jgi:Tfp pilus assembly protein FimV
VRLVALRTLAMTGAAVTALAPAHAVTLGEVIVDSTLGEPLSARIPVAVAPGEFLDSNCVGVPPGRSDGFGQLPQPLVKVPQVPASGSLVLSVTTQRPLYEPMYELQLEVRCPGTALLVRQYVLMLDPPGTGSAAFVPAAAAPLAAPAAAVAAPRSQVSRPSAGRAPRIERPSTPIAPGSTYRVVAGDTLSTIAARVSGSGERLWARAERIFAANPEAFINGNQDLLKLGSLLVIPAGAAPVQPPAADLAQGRDAPAATNAIPAAAAAPALDAPLAPAAASPVDEPEVALEPAAVEAVAAPPVPVFEDELPARTVAAPASASKPSPSAAEPPDSGGAPAWLAGLIGVLIGSLVSLVMLRERLLEGLRAVIPGRSRHEDVPEAPPEPRPAPASVRMLPVESTMVVVEGPAPAGFAAHARSTFAQSESARAAHEATAPQEEVPETTETPAGDLAALFGGDVDVPAIDIGLPSQETAVDLDLTAAGTDAAVDDELAWSGAETALSPTLEATAVRSLSDSGTVEQLDLHALAHRAIDDAQISQTLKDALTLLESDYETELTASQVIDRAKLEQDLEEDTEDELARTGTGRHRR